MNVIGERQHPEKYLPLCIKKILAGEKIHIHSDPNKNPGTRFYVHARNVADVSLFLTKEAEAGDKYNLVGQKEVSNLELAQMVAEILGKELNYELVDFHSSRPGHDLRYALEDTLKKTIQWTIDNPKWLAG